MNRVVATVALALAVLCSGCVNCIVRATPSEPCVRGCYQQTRIALGVAVVTACPQMMQPTGVDGLEAYNILTIPLGIVVLVDAAAEAVVDTVCLPYDFSQQ